MRFYKKYTFDSESQANQMINDLGDNIKHSIVKLGYLSNDEDEKENPIFSDKYSVDVLWRELSQDENGNTIYPDNWKEKELSGLNSYKHHFLGWEYDQ
jgi:hypothetical protein